MDPRPSVRVRRRRVWFSPCLLAVALTPALAPHELTCAPRPGVHGSSFPCTEQGILDAIAEGGGVHQFDCDGPTTVTTEQEIIVDNDVILDGGGNLAIDGNDDHLVLSVAPDVVAELRGMTVSGGYVPGVGGGIVNEGTLTLVGASVRDNFAIDGVGITNSGSLTLKRSRISGNIGYYGCGISSTGSTMLIDSEVSDNHCSDGGLFNSGTLTLINSAVLSNSSEGPGITSYGPTTLINSTVSDNYTTVVSGIRQAQDVLTLINSTIVGTDLRSSVYVIDAEAAELVAVNSLIVSQNPEGSGCTAIGVSGGGNIESPGDSCGLADPTDLVNASPEDLKLGPLADNGGPTMTHALLAGSVAIDRIPEDTCVDADGQPLTTDQRGARRPEAGGTMCDVGAFEVQRQSRPPIPGR